MVAVLGQELALQVGGVWRRFRTLGTVQSGLAAQFPEKVLIGDSSRSDGQLASNFIGEDFSGGLGVEIMDPKTQFDRLWDSTLWTLNKNLLTLPPRAKDLGRGTVTVGKDPVAGAQFRAYVYVAFGDDVRRLETDDTISASKRTLGNTATDATAYGGTLYFAWGGGYDYSADGAAWTRASAAGDEADYFVSWDSKLWKIRNDGSGFGYTTTGASASWTAKATMGLETGEVRGLEVFFTPDNILNIHAITSRGLWVYDASANGWRQTMFQHARHPDGGLGHTFYRDALYSSAGMSVWKFTGQAASNVGLDRDYGLPAAQRGKVRRLLPTQNWLAALVDGSAPVLAGTKMRAAAYGGTVTFPASVGSSGLYLYNDRGWNYLWRSGAAARAARWAGVFDAYGDYRLLFGNDGGLSYIKLSPALYNPLQSSDAQAWGFASSGYLVTPWYDGTWAEIAKTAAKLVLRTRNTSPTETVTVSVGYDLDPNAFTVLATLTAPGKFTYTFGDGLGKTFEYIRFRIEMARGADKTKTPSLVYFGLKYTKDPSALWNISALLDTTDQYAGLQPVEQIALLEATAGQGGYIPTSWRDEDGSVYVRYMRLVRLVGQEQPGAGGHFRGRWQVALTEV
ncbi:MAG: hypothetical protein HYX52_05680 [Chloroflexi bacterium]|nr:hypothetical protein [Chloroflexota bacterium]